MPVDTMCTIRRVSLVPAVNTSNLHKRVYSTVTIHRLNTSDKLYLQYTAHIFLRHNAIEIERHRE
jgi:hypothetical protein